MADVEMKDTSGASARTKGSSKASESANDGKKRFEVKKALSAKRIKAHLRPKNARLLGGFAT
ncbi:hypothetical protein EYZ11_006790 [Aspergillus tanneri]|uniref:Uncharacterized protein n=1 Tax=Aspergillus tanneri TaxID=1220188 RepID=A0A4V3UP59_9EURO|nr:hypothetical protein EYZ11_006790 [Aspergillus tanneri]